MARGHSLDQFGEVINYHKDSRVVVVSGAYIKMVILNQFIEIPTLDFFQVKSNVTKFVTYLLTRETGTDSRTDQRYDECQARYGVPVFAPEP